LFYNFNEQSEKEINKNLYTISWKEKKTNKSLLEKLRVKQELMKKVKTQQTEILWTYKKTQLSAEDLTKWEGKRQIHKRKTVI
jgi:hypothetical protein